MLPKAHRLTQAAVQEVLSQGRSFHQPHFSIRVSDTEGGGGISVVVPRKGAAKAHTRARLRRRVYAALAAYIDKQPTRNAIVFVKPGADACTFEEISTELHTLLQKARLL